MVQWRILRDIRDECSRYDSLNSRHRSLRVYLSTSRVAVRRSGHDYIYPRDEDDELTTEGASRDKDGWRKDVNNGLFSFFLKEGIIHIYICISRKILFKKIDRDDLCRNIYDNFFILLYKERQYGRSIRKIYIHGCSTYTML